VPKFDLKFAADLIDEYEEDTRVSDYEYDDRNKSLDYSMEEMYEDLAAVDTHSNYKQVNNDWVFDWDDQVDPLELIYINKE
jgi:hypothetical protein